MNPTLIGVFACLVLWIVTAFARPVGVSAVHLFLVAAVLLLVRRIVLGKTKI